jgi:hypothetical protein
MQDLNVLQGECQQSADSQHSAFIVHVMSQRAGLHFFKHFKYPWHEEVRSFSFCICNILLCL